MVIGENSARCAYSCIPISTHAEIDALLKLKSYYMRTKQKRPLRMNLLVVRITKTGKLNNAEPCHHCMLQLIRANFVNIQNLYYTNSSGTITCRKFTDVIDNPNTFISSGYRVRMGMSTKVEKKRTQTYNVCVSITIKTRQRED
jgi:hypothetical protein